MNLGSVSLQADTCIDVFNSRYPGRQLNGHARYAGCRLDLQQQGTKGRGFSKVNGREHRLLDLDLPSAFKDRADKGGTAAQNFPGKQGNRVLQRQISGKDGIPDDRPLFQTHHFASSSKRNLAQPCLQILYREITRLKVRFVTDLCFNTWKHRLPC